MYTNARYYNDLLMGRSPGGILCDINGVASSVPIDPANTDYANIMQLVAEGKLTIAPAGE